MKKLLLAIFSLISIISYSQTTGYFRYDTVRLEKPGGNTTLVIRNATRDSLGFLYNYGGGRTKFEVIRSVPGGIKIGEDTIVINQSDLTDGLISPGYVTYSGTGLKFYISPSVYVIDGTIYTTDYDSVTLATADPDDPRKDVIYVATTGVEVKTGVPAGPAAEPQMEAGQIKLTVVDIQNGASVPTITTNIIYDENTGESTVTNIGTTTDPDNTEDPYHLTKAVEFTNVDNLDAGIFTLPSTVDITTYEGISMFLRLKGVMHSTARIYVTFGNGSNWISNEVQVTMNKNSLTYQGLTVPMSLFTFTNAFVDKIRIRWYQSSPVVHPGFYLDYVHWESGVQQPGGGSTPMTVGAIGSKLPSPNGAVIENNVFYQQPASQTYPGLLSAADKTKLDSLRSDYLMENVGDGEELATQVNDSTVGIKSLKAGTGVTLASTDTTVTINAIAGAQTLQQTFDQEVGGSVLTKIDTISTNNTLKILGSTTSFAELLRVDNSSTTGGAIVASGAGTNATIRAINNKTSSGGGTAILGEAYGSNATGALTRDSSSTATVIKILDLNRTTSGSAANGIGGSIHFNVENSSANTFFANSVESIWKNSIDANKESMLRIRGVNNTVEEVYMDIQKGGIVIVNNGADTLAKLSDLTGGGSYTDADARAAISLTTTGSSGAATYNSGTGVFNIPDYSSGTSIWNGTVIGTSFSATSTTISSAALQWTFTGSSPATFTLPARTSSVNQFYTIKNIGSADLTVAAAGTDDIFTTTSVSSITVVPGGSVMITGAANGTSDLWTALFHTGDIPNIIVDSIGSAGTDVVVVRNDSILHRLITTAYKFITVDTTSDGRIRIGLDTASADLKTYISDNSGAGSGTDRFSITLTTATNTTFTDAQSIYFSSFGAGATTLATAYAITIDRACTLKAINIDSYCNTAGSNESWSLYVRVNNTTDYLIESVSASTNNRTWDNNAINISLNQGDVIVIKSINPTWATNPASGLFGGYAIFEY